MTWSEAFAAYLKRHSIPAHEAAAAVGVAPSTVHYWTKGSEPRGERGQTLKKKIERWSKGEVKAAPWEPPTRSSPPPSRRTGTDG